MADEAVTPLTANTVASYKDGVGNLISAIQWNGDAGTQANILTWTHRAHMSGKGVLRIQNDHLLQHVGLNDWLVMDSRRADFVFPTTNPQMRATYELPGGGPIP